MNVELGNHHIDFCIMVVNKYSPKIMLLNTYGFL